MLADQLPFTTLVLGDDLRPIGRAGRRQLTELAVNRRLDGAARGRRRVREVHPQLLAFGHLQGDVEGGIAHSRQPAASRTPGGLIVENLRGVRAGIHRLDADREGDGTGGRGRPREFGRDAFADVRASCGTKPRGRPVNVVAAGGHRRRGSTRNGPGPAEEQGKEGQRQKQRAQNTLGVVVLHNNRSLLWDLCPYLTELMIACW